MTYLRTITLRSRNRLTPSLDPTSHPHPLLLTTSFVLEMGNKESASNDGVFSSPARSSTLEANDLRSVAKYMKSEECQNIYVMVCSTSPTNIRDA